MRVRIVAHLSVFVVRSVDLPLQTSMLSPPTTATTLRMASVTGRGIIPVWTPRRLTTSSASAVTPWRADWERARALFEQAAELEETAEILDGLGEALQFGGEHARAIEVKERALAEYERRGLRAEAAELARWLAFLHVSVHGNGAAASGWMARAESLLEGVEECAAHGWLMLDRAPWSSDASERVQLATAAIAIAKRYGDRDLELDAMSLLGDAYVGSGRVADGMRLLDQVMVAVAAGEVVGVGAAGEIYWRFLSACERATDVRRAEEWLGAATRFESWRDFVPPTCRTHYGGILIALGRWEQAERELLAAIRTFETGYWASQLFPLVRLADLRVRQGRFEEAERLLENIDWHASAKQLLARIALARGDLALAEDLARLCVEGTQPTDPDCLPLIGLLVEVQLARGDVAAAAASFDQLAALAAGSESDRARAIVSLAKGSVEAIRDDKQARADFQAAVGLFSTLGLALEAAQARVALARTLGSHAPAAAVVEARHALETFERLGAAREADGAAALLRELGARERTFPKGYGTLTKRETEVLTLLAEGCSNADIATRLYISRRTAEHHVAHILSKLAYGTARRQPCTPTAHRPEIRSRIGIPTDAGRLARGDPQLSWRQSRIGSSSRRTMRCSPGSHPRPASTAFAGPRARRKSSNSAPARHFCTYTVG
jgi:DNA-binding CsgD family transcriptional regulator